jgi:hypothetical protein
MGVRLHAACFWQLARGTALTGGVAGRAAGRGSGDGIDRTVLETRLGNPGAVLETDLPDAGRGTRDVSGTLHLAQALSNCGRRGRKKDLKPIPSQIVASRSCPTGQVLVA